MSVTTAIGRFSLPEDEFDIIQGLLILPKYLQVAIDETDPEKVVIPRRNRNAWISSDLQLLINERCRKYKNIGLNKFKQQLDWITDNYIFFTLLTFLYCLLRRTIHVSCSIFIFGHRPRAASPPNSKTLDPHTYIHQYFVQFDTPAQRASSLNTHIWTFYSYSPKFVFYPPF